MSSLVFDAAGNIYGTNIGNIGYGEVFELTPKGSRSRKFTLLHDFNGNGAYPHGALVLDSTGSLYGTTYQGGSAGYGIVYELLRTSSGQWALNVLWNFSGGVDGAYPQNGLLRDAAGNLYGVTPSGGASANGVVFKVFRDTGTWHESVIYAFSGGADGSSPFSSLVADSAKNLYGTTFSGGASGVGTVFKITNP